MISAAGHLRAVHLPGLNVVAESIKFLIEMPFLALVFNNLYLLETQSSSENPAYSSKTRILTPLMPGGHNVPENVIPGCYAHSSAQYLH